MIKKDGEWWTGVLNGKTGVFPSNYVQKMEYQVMAFLIEPVEQIFFNSFIYIFLYHFMQLGEIINCEKSASTTAAISPPGNALNGFTKNVCNSMSSYSHVC